MTMHYLKRSDKFFWVFLVLSVVLGLTFPNFFKPYEGLVIYIIMIIMCLLFLKADILEVATHIKKPFLVLYINIIKLILLPISIYFLLQDSSLELQVALFFLAALPTGVSSSVITDIMNGRTSLNLAIVIVSNLLSVFTIPFLFYHFYNTEIGIDSFAIFESLCKIIFIPLLIAKAIKHVFMPTIVKKIQSYLNFKIIILLSIMIMISISIGAETLLDSFISEQLPTIGLLFTSFIAFQLIGYFAVFWRPKAERLASSNSCMIMNNILGIVLALTIFENHPDILNIIILSLLPWNVMIITKHWYKPYLP